MEFDRVAEYLIAISCTADAESSFQRNHTPAKYEDKLASLFMLVHGTQADCRSWLPLFSICYFHHDPDGSTKRSKNQAQTMDDIIYNPNNKLLRAGLLPH